MEQRAKVTLSQVHHYLKIECVQWSSSNTYQGLSKVFLFPLQPLFPTSNERLSPYGRNETGKNMLIEMKRIRTKFSEQGVLHGKNFAKNTACTDTVMCCWVSY